MNLDSSLMKQFRSLRGFRCGLIAIILNGAFSLGFGQTPTSTAEIPTTGESAPTPIHPPTKKFRELLNTAQGYLATGNYTIARNWFRLALDARPGNITAIQGFEQADKAAVEVGDCSAQQEAEQDQLQQKMQTLVLPQVYFDHLRLADAIEFFRREISRLEIDTVQGKRGTTIFVKYPTASTDLLFTSGTPEDKAANPLPTPDIPVSAHLYNLSLLDALIQVLRPMGMCAKVRFEGVYLTGALEVWPDHLITREYHLEAFIFCADKNQLAEWEHARAAGGTSVEQVDAKTYLEASGVTFPAGASSFFLPVQQKLVVRNTRENLELIECIMPHNPLRLISSDHS